MQDEREALYLVLKFVPWENLQVGALDVEGPAGTIGCCFVYGSAKDVPEEDRPLAVMATPKER